MPLQALLLPPLWLSIAQRFKKNNDNALLTFWLPMQCQERLAECQEHLAPKCQEHPQCPQHLAAAADSPEHRALSPELPLIVDPRREERREEAATRRQRRAQRGA